MLEKRSEIEVDSKLSKTYKCTSCGNLFGKEQYVVEEDMCKMCVGLTEIQGNGNGTEKNSQ